MGPEERQEFDGGSQKRGHFGAEVVSFLRRLLKRAFFSWRTSFFGTARSGQGRAVIRRGAANP